MLFLSFLSVSKHRPTFVSYEKQPNQAPDDYDNEYDSEKEFDENMPYGIQNVRDVFQNKIRSLQTNPIVERPVNFQTALRCECLL